VSDRPAPRLTALSSQHRLFFVVQPHKRNLSLSIYR
jgi:hypothetical protein